MVIEWKFSSMTANVVVDIIIAGPTENVPNC